MVYRGPCALNFLKRSFTIGLHRHLSATVVPGIKMVKIFPFCGIRQRSIGVSSHNTERPDFKIY